MDVFVEQIIAKRKEPKEIALTFLIILAVPVLTVGSLFVPLLQNLTLLIFPAACFGAWWLITSMNVEFEYSVTNGDLTVDKIIAKRRRKRLINLDCKNAEAFGRYDAARFTGRNFDNKLFVGSAAAAPEQWYVIVRHKKLNHTLIVFEPEKRVLEAMRPFLPKLIAMEAFKEFGPMTKKTSHGGEQ